MNYLLISHCSFRGNSGIHAYHIAEHLVQLGWDVSVSVPQSPEDVFSAFGVDQVPFNVITYGTCGLAGLFRDGRGADVIHAFTPREHVRNETLRLAEFYNAPYIVHLEDNEEEILRQELGVDSIGFLSDLPALHVAEHVRPWRIAPAFYRSFLTNASGVTALVDRLLEFNLGGRPSLVFWPGFDERYLEPIDVHAARQALGLPEDAALLVYSGAVHDVNTDEVEQLILAVAELNRRGRRVRLVKTGTDAHPLIADLPKGLSDLVINLGFLNRSDLPRVALAADVLVQPGRSSLFNDYRFPSKLPEYFATGRPVVLPATNIGLHVRDGVEALLLTEGGYREIADKVETLLADPALADRIGREGRSFAQRALSWRENVGEIHSWVDQLITGLREQAGSTKEQEVLCRDVHASMAEQPRLVAFYLPQFHSIPENDRWWGEGFTDWTNVKRAEPNYHGHYQPRVPAELGYYDLRTFGVMERQAELAKLHGVFGFCYYYYWFSGKRLLEEPLEAMLRRGKPVFPFCLCWANENWTRRWDGLDQEVLIAQDYGDGWIENFFDAVLPYLQDPRYIRVDGVPLFVLYRFDHIPEVRRAVLRWKELARDAGLLGLHVVGVQYIGMTPATAVEMGLDGSVEFPPHLHPADRELIDPETVPGIRPDFGGYVEDYPTFKRHLMARPPVDERWYRGLMPGWDNTARRGVRSHSFLNACPEGYEEWLRYLLDYSRCARGGQPLIFVNAWNEWGEGAYLEPDRRFGWGYLEATSRALKGYVPIRAAQRYEPVSPSGSSGRVRRKVGNSPDLGFCDDSFVRDTLARYATGERRVPSFSYATVRDLCDSRDHLAPLANHGDLKNVQRPWALKAILAQVPTGGKILEFGGGHPLISATLFRLGYDVTIVDPYDGTGHGPLEYQQYADMFPEVRIVRGYFRPGTPELSGEAGTFDAVYSISVIEHVPLDELKLVFAAMRTYLRRDRGLSIHAIDFIRKGAGADSHLAMLRVLAEMSGVDQREIDQVLVAMDGDVETYYLSAEAHDAWRMGLSYEEFPMRVCVSLQLCTPAVWLSSLE